MFQQRKALHGIAKAGLQLQMASCAGYIGANKLVVEEVLYVARHVPDPIPLF